MFYRREERRLAFFALRLAFLRRVARLLFRLRKPPFWLSVLNRRAVGSTPPGHVVYVLEAERGAGWGGERIVFILLPHSILCLLTRRFRQRRHRRVRPPPRDAD